MDRLQRRELNANIEKIHIEIDEIRVRIAKMALESEQLTLLNKKLFLETVFYPLVVLGGLTGFITLIVSYFR